MSTDPNRLDRARRMTLRLMDELGREHLGTTLTDLGWTFVFDDAKRRAGVCRYRPRQIGLSRYLTTVMPWDEVEDTIRHEIAHALDFHHRGRSGHDEDWKIWALYCGARPKRCYQFDAPPDPSAPYQGTCPGCGATKDYYRQPIFWRRCGTCTAARRPSYYRIVHRDTGAVIREGGWLPGPFLGWVGHVAVCHECEDEQLVARRPRHGAACGRCCDRHADGEYDERFELDYRSNAHRKPAGM